MNTAPLAAALTHLRKETAPIAARPSDRQLLDAYAANDPTAFASLVQRHGPMVLGVCRRVLRHEQDAEDAFQAVFLVLARGARTIRKSEALASWLYGVSSRVALRARRDAARRRKHEARAEPRDNPPAWEVGWRELQSALDEEVARLPAAYRAVFLLCCLEGLSKPEAAARLGVKENTVSSRLARARRRLQGRLARRGISLAAVLAALAVAGAGRAAVAPRLSRAATEAATRLRAGAPVTGLSEKALALAEGTTRTMLPNSIKLTAMLLLALAALGTGLGVFARPPGQGPPAPPAAKSKPPAPAVKDEGKERITYGGRVLGPDGRPFAGAKLYLTMAMGYLRRPAPSPEYAMSGPDGRFRFTVPKAEFGDHYTIVTATAANCGPGWVDVKAGGRRDDLTLRLVKDDVPITGQIVDLEGKPVAGATLTVMQINAAPAEDLGPWLAAARAKKGLDWGLERQFLNRYTIALSPRVKTDAAGRFRLTGIGRDRVVWARLDGPTLASEQLHVWTRPGKAIEVTHHEGDPEYHDPRIVTTYYGASFRHVAAPSRPIVGVVRDQDTKKPLAGVKVRSHTVKIGPGAFRQLDTEVSTTTDAEGRFRLTGMPKGQGYKILAIPGGDQPYVVTSQDVSDTTGLGPVTVDFALKRGVWVEGKITDKATGKPVRGGVEYMSMYSNPHLLSDYPGFVGTIAFNTVAVKADGTYRVVGLPGPGLICVIYHQDTYLRAPDRDDEFGTKERSLNTAPFAITHPVNYNALARIDPDKGAETVRRDITLGPGWALKATVVGPDGKPLAGARSLNLNSSWVRWGPEGMKTAELTAWFHPRRPREVLLRHSEKGLVGVARPPKENGASVTVRMESGATVTGRLVDADGKPRPGVDLEVQFHPKEWGSWLDYLPEGARTDHEGRFRVAALLPGYEFRLSDGQGELLLGGALRTGQTKALGDVRMKPTKEQ
jgi:RNA polymerase sigma factor (sigma-70 family)